jgi:diguanylate cyclase
MARMTSTRGARAAVAPPATPDSAPLDSAQPESAQPESAPPRPAAPRLSTHRSMVRLLATYAAISLVPIIVLGLVLAWSYGSEARQRGVAEGRSEAVLVAQTAIEPSLSGRPLSQGLSAAETTSLQALVSKAVREHQILRLRLHALTGDVVFSSDRQGFTEQPEDEVTEAAHGEIEADVSRLNSDPGDIGKIGPA